jgi:hypothetical protein
MIPFHEARSGASRYGTAELAKASFMKLPLSKAILRTVAFS